MTLLSSNQIYESPDPIQEVMLSGDGRTFFVLTRFNRLTFFNDTATTEIYTPFPGLAH